MKTARKAKFSTIGFTAKTNILHLWGDAFWRNSVAIVTSGPVYLSRKDEVFAVKVRLSVWRLNRRRQVKFVDCTSGLSFLHDGEHVIATSANEYRLVRAQKILGIGKWNFLGMTYQIMEKFRSCCFITMGSYIDPVCPIFEMCLDMGIACIHVYNFRTRYESSRFWYDYRYFGSSLNRSFHIQFCNCELKGNLSDYMSEQSSEVCALNDEDSLVGFVKAAVTEQRYRQDIGKRDWRRLYQRTLPFGLVKYLVNEAESKGARYGNVEYGWS